MRKVAYLFSFFLLYPIALFAQTPPSAVVEAALRDSASIPEQHRPYQRYIWVPRADATIRDAVVFTLNLSLTRTGLPIIPEVLVGGHLLRVDLRAIAPDEKDYVQIFTIWEDLASIEPYFHVFQTIQTKVKVEPFKAKDGKTYDFKFEAVQTPTPHPRFGVSLLALSDNVKSVCPIVRGDWLTYISNGTIGKQLYYDWRGIKGMKFKDYLLSRGASQEQVEKLRSEERAALFYSGVTGKERMIRVFPGAGVRSSVGSSLIWITDDVFDEDDDPTRSPIRNLLDFPKSGARGNEVIVDWSNGGQEWTIWNSAGDLLDWAPDNVVADHLVPAPHTKRLFPPLSCIRCHGPHEGLIPFDNQVKKLWEGMRGKKGAFEVYDDLSSKDSVPKTLQILAEMFTGDLGISLRKGRDSYSNFIFRLVQKTVPDISEDVSSVYAGYWYSLVAADTACRELGIPFQVGGTDAETLAFSVEALRQAVPPIPLGADGISPEDPDIAALLSALPIHRQQFEQIYGDLLNRVIIPQRNTPEQGDTEIPQQVSPGSVPSPTQ